MIPSSSGEEEGIERDIEHQREHMGESEAAQHAISEMKQQVKEKKKSKNSNKKKNKKKEKKMSSREYGLVSYDELPEYMKENEFIRNYYRSEWPLSHAFFSLFSWHNETINIWTHLIGFFVFLGFTLVHFGHVPQVADLLANLPWSISLSAGENASCNQANIFSSVSPPFIKLDQPPPSTPTAARWPFFTFLAGSMFCLLTSSLCHLLCCHSRRLNIFLARLDYSGIAVMIVTSFFPPIYYIFQCEPAYQTTYLTAISAFGILTVFTLFAPELSKGKFRTYRALLFSAMGFFGIIPAVHATVVNWTEPKRDITLAYEGAMAALYVMGTMFYVSRVPERWWPGRFDIAGCSHQIFHVLVVGGALAHYGAALIFIEFRDANGCGKL